MKLLSVITAKLAPYKIAIGVALLVGCFSAGYYKATVRAHETASRIALEHQLELTERARELETARANVTERVVTKYVDRIKIVKETEYVTSNIIQDHVPDRFSLSNGWVYTYDSIVKGTVPDASRASDEAASGITATDALGSINTNYGICKQNAEQLVALQDWVRQLHAETSKP